MHQNEQLLTEIRSIEKEAKEILEATERQCTQMISGANSKAVNSLAQKEKEFAELKENTLRAIMQEASKAKEKLLTKKGEEIKLLKESASKKKAIATQAILRRLTELIGE